MDSTIENVLLGHFDSLKNIPSGLLSDTGSSHPVLEARRYQDTPSCIYSSAVIESPPLTYRLFRTPADRNASLGSVDRIHDTAVGQRVFIYVEVLALLRLFSWLCR